MVRLAVFLLIMYTGLTVSAQDLIIKRSGEKIFCSIHELTDYYVHFYEIQDIDKLLLYKMDVALIESVTFAGSEDDDYSVVAEVEKANNRSKKIHSVETNIDGLLNNYFSVFYQFLQSSYALDIGFKRYSGSPEFNGFGSFDDSGSSFEFGVSAPLKEFGNDDHPYRGIYLRGFAIYNQGTFVDRLQSFFFVQEYAQAVFGAQLVVPYQFTNRLYAKGYYGLAGSVDIDSFAPSIRRADLSSSGGIKSIFGLRFGFLF